MHDVASGLAGHAGPTQDVPRESKVRPGRLQGDTGETTRTQKRAQEARKDPKRDPRVSPGSSKRWQKRPNDPKRGPERAAVSSGGGPDSIFPEKVAKVMEWLHVFIKAAISADVFSSFLGTSAAV